MTIPGIIAGGGQGGQSAAVLDPYFDNVVVLLGFDGANGSTSIVDESRFARAMTANGSAQISTAQSKFGGSSLLFNGGNVTSPDSEDFNFGVSNFTIEGFVRFSSLANSTIIRNFTTSTGWVFQYSHTFAIYQFVVNAGGALSEAGPPPTSQWLHYCIERFGNTLRFYIDGVMVDKVSNGSTIANAATTLLLGDLPGNADEWRITYGIARYNSDAGFTVPTERYPRSGPVSTGDYRYWKIKCTGTNDGSGDCLFREVSLAESHGGTDIGRYGRITGTGGHYSANEGADKAFNDNTGDWWQPRVPGGGSVELLDDFLTKRTLREATFDPHPSFLNRTPTGIEILGSNDNSLFTQVANFTGLTGWTGSRTLQW